VAVVISQEMMLSMKCLFILLMSLLLVGKNVTSTSTSTSSSSEMESKEVAETTTEVKRNESGEWK